MPVLVPPDFTMMVASPSRVEDVFRRRLIVHAKSTWLVFDSSVCSCPSGKHLLSCDTD